MRLLPVFAVLACAYGSGCRPHTTEAPEPPSSAAVLPLPPHHQPAVHARPHTPYGDAIVSPFHRWASESDVSAELGSRLRMCSVRGATFLCGRPRVFRLGDGQFVRDVALEAGLARTRDDPDSLRGFVTDIVGSWPDDAWLVSDEYDLGSLPRVVYHWSGKRWVAATPPIHVYDETFDLLPWGRNGALRLSSRGDPQRLVAIGIGSAAAASMPVVPYRGCHKVSWVQDAKPDGAGGAFAFVTYDCGSSRSAFEHWASPAATPVVLADVPEENEFHPMHAFFAASPTDVALYGIAREGGAYLQHFDGRSWESTPLPGAPVSITSYARSADEEWLVTYDGFAGPTRLWRRSASSDWEGVPLPRDVSGAALNTIEGALWIVSSTENNHSASRVGVILSESVPDEEVALTPE